MSPKASKRNNLVKLMLEINKIENRGEKNREKSMQPKAGSLKIQTKYKTDSPLVKLTKKKELKLVNWE